MFAKVSQVLRRVVGGIGRSAAIAMLATSPSVGLAAPLAQDVPVSESLFSRLDPFPPDDFRAALGWSGGGGGSEGTFCSLAKSGALYMADNSTQERMLSDATTPCVLGLNDILQVVPGEDLTAAGWRSDVPISLVVRRPDGALVSETEDEFGNMQLSIDLDAPLGEYQVSARQGPTRTASGVFSVVRQARLPIIRAIPHERWAGETFGTPTAAPGTAVDVRLAGYAPNQTVKLLLYDNSENHVFRATIATIQADSAGRALYRLPTAPDDRQGVYRIQTVPMAQGAQFPRLYGAELCIAAPPNFVPCGQDDGSRELLFQRMVSQSNLVWASVAARSGAPLSDLACVYGANLLPQMQHELSDMRRRGRYTVAREVAPPSIQQVVKLEGTELGERAQVDVVEHLSVLVFDADGSLVADESGDVPHQYIYAQNYKLLAMEDAPPACRSGWVIVDDV